MQKIELTSKFVLAALIATVVFSAITVPYAVAQSSSSPPIRANSVTSGSIKDGEVKTADLANDAVTSSKIKNGEVKAEDIAPGVIPSGVQPTVHRVDGEFVHVAPNSDAQAEAICPDGELITGGGYDGNPGTSLSLSLPVDGNKWVVRVHNTISTETFFAAVAQCMDFTP